MIRVQRRPLIESIEVTPERVCRGEDILVRVRLTAGAEKAKVVVHRRAGNPVALRFDEAGEREIAVIARDWSDGIDARKVRVQVDDCIPAAFIRVGTRRLTADRVAFDVLDVQLDGGEPAFHWDFGDGATRQGTERSVVHDYALRDQDGPYTTFLAVVEARTPGGDSTKQQVAVTLLNNHFIASHTGPLMLPVRSAPFPEGSATAPVSRATVRNVAAEIVTFDTAELRGFPCDDSGGAPIPALYPADAVNAAVAIHPGDTAAVSLVLPMDAWWEPICLVEVRLRGWSTSGKPAMALWAVSIAAPSSARTVADPDLARKAVQARAILGRDRITLEELEQLEREGKLHPTSNHPGGHLQ